MYIKNVHVIKTMSRESDGTLENVALLSCVVMEKRTGTRGVAVVMKLLYCSSQSYVFASLGFYFEIFIKQI